MRHRANAWSCRLHLWAFVPGTRQENFFERGVARFDDLATSRENRVTELLERSAMDNTPRAATALHGERGIKSGRLIEGLGEAHATALIGTSHVVEHPAQRHAAPVHQRDVVRHPLDFVEQ